MNVLGDAKGCSEYRSEYLITNVFNWFHSAFQIERATKLLAKTTKVRLKNLKVDSHFFCNYSGL
jgi:hypothetical protein